MEQQERCLSNFTVDEKNIGKGYSIILYQYSKYIEVNQTKLGKIPNLTYNELLDLRRSLQCYYNCFSDLEVATSKLRHLDNEIRKTSITIEDENKEVFYKDLNGTIQVLLERISYRYLHPITVQLNELDIKESRKRDRIIFILSVVLSVVLSAVSSLVITYIFDKKNDEDLNVFFNSIFERSLIIQEDINNLHPLIDTLQLTKD